MENVIWKFTLDMNELDSTDSLDIMIPVDAKILCVQSQYNIPCIWAIVNPCNHTVKKRFTIKGTGHTFQDVDLQDTDYIGTYQLYEGKLIYHVFEQKSIV